jgi:hypothetical protein
MVWLKRAEVSYPMVYQLTDYIVLSLFCFNRLLKVTEKDNKYQHNMVQRQFTANNSPPVNSPRGNSLNSPRGNSPRGSSLLGKSTIGATNRRAIIRGTVHLWLNPPFLIFSSSILYFRKQNPRKYKSTFETSIGSGYQFLNSAHHQKVFSRIRGHLRFY